MPAPTVTATLNKTSYNSGDAVEVTFTVQDAPVQVPHDRTITWTGKDGEGNAVSGSLTTTVMVPEPDTFTLDSVKWSDTNTPLTIAGHKATGVA